jgi:hypothetical protein
MGECENGSRFGLAWEEERRGRRGESKEMDGTAW